MQIIEDSNTSRYQIRAYKPGEITINDTTYTQSFIIMSDTLIVDWGPQCMDDITPMHIDQILALKPNIILLGTGDHFKIPPNNTLRSFDCMSTGAACRTFIALSSEGRRVAAALLIDSGNTHV